MSNGMKQTEIGEIPVEWEVVRLVDLCERITKGTTPTTMGFKYQSNGINFVKIESIGANGSIIKKMVAFIDEKAHSSLQRSQLKEKDILFSIAGALGRTAIVNSSILPANTNQALAIVRLKNKEQVKYIYHFLRSKFVTSIIQKINVQTAQANLSLGDIQKFTVPLPPLPEQQKIAEILSTVDEKIAVIDEQLAKTTELKTGLMQRLLTKGIGHTEFKDSPLGEIPEGWEVLQLGDVLELINGKAFQPNEWSLSGLPIIRIQNLNNSNAPFNYFDGHVEDRYYVHVNDILFAWSGTKGVSFGARIWKGEKAVLNQHIFRVVPDETKIDYSFAYILLKQVQAEIETKAHGFKSSFVHVKKSDITKLKFALPPLKEQRQIAELLTTLDDKIQVLHDKKAHYQTLKRGLMQQLLTGKLRVRMAQDAVAA